eukprot:m.360389 g.360389  ORF g.360389 m.360389 type:complete len:68 (-) comp19017_c0_seq1:1165-1368(-)
MKVKKQEQKKKSRHIKKVGKQEREKDLEKEAKEVCSLDDLHAAAPAASGAVVIPTREDRTVSIASHP